MKLRIFHLAILAVFVSYAQPSLAKFRPAACPVEGLSVAQLDSREGKLKKDLKEIEAFLVWDLGGKKRGGAIVTRLLAGENVKLPPIAKAAWNQHKVVEGCISKIFAVREALTAPPAVATFVDPGAGVMNRLIAGEKADPILVPLLIGPSKENVVSVPLNDGSKGGAGPGGQFQNQVSAELNRQIANSITRGIR
ncbi:MAG: hypothetical protein AAB250_19405 [Bdellovibrionota bacterium]